MDGQPLDEQYLHWLYRRVASVRLKNPARTYWSLMKQLYAKEFVWLIPNDDNRVEDGRDLRYEFLAEYGVEDVDLEWMGLGCSFLEMLIGLARRLAFEAADIGDVRDWFWILLENLNLARFNDAVYVNEIQERTIDEVLDAVIWRTFNSDGSGGLFPLEDAQEDQRDVEIWYQLSAFLSELSERA